MNPFDPSINSGSSRAQSRDDKLRIGLFFIILAFFFLYGCGYTTHSVLPANKSSIYVENFLNKIDISREISHEKPFYAYKPLMESDITREIIDRFIFDGNLQVKERSGAHLLLKGSLVDFRREPLRYDANDNVVEYRLSAVCDIELYDLKEDQVLWEEKGFAGESTYRTSGQFAKSESTAIDEAISDLAERVVERTIENW